MHVQVAQMVYTTSQTRMWPRPDPVSSNVTLSGQDRDPCQSLLTNGEVLVPRHQLILGHLPKPPQIILGGCNVLELRRFDFLGF